MDRPLHHLRHVRGLRPEYVATPFLHGRSQTTPLQSASQIADLWPIVAYIMRKGSIAGPSWKAPFIGPFLQSMNPKFEEYYGKWKSGPLSCVSVFHK